MANEVSKVELIMAKHSPNKNSLLAILQDVQEEFNYLPKEVLEAVSVYLGIPLIDVVGVATFYRAFSLKPRGEHTAKVCLGTACHIRGGPKILDEFINQLNIQPGETTADGKFSLETVNCLGCCAIGPVVVIDDNYYSHVQANKVNKIIKQYLKERKGKK